MKFSGFSKKAQVAVEYLFILALALAIIVPGSMLFFNYSKDSGEQIVSSQVNKIGKNIVSQSEDIYTIGKNSWITLEIVFPKEILDAYFIDDELVITYETQRGITEAVFFSDVPIISGNLSSNMHTGFMKIKIESQGDQISVQEI